jgi:Zn-dependent protease with chaperone function
MMADAPSLDFNAYVTRKKAERAGGEASSEFDYSFSLDRQSRAAVESARPIQLAVASTVRLWKQVWKGQLLGSAVRVSERQFPRIQALTRECSEQLGIAVPQVYIVNNPHLNAGTFGTDEESFILVHSALVDHYSDEELRTVLGHECGHIHNSHVVYLTTLHYLKNIAAAFLPWIVYPAMIPLNELSRRAEITCDRAGMLCAKNEHVAARALTKLVLGSRKLYDEFNLDAFLEQYEEGKDSIGRYMEALATHPYLPKRVLAMRVFAESELYKKTAGVAPTEGLSMTQVDDRVKALLKGEA